MGYKIQLITDACGGFLITTTSRSLILVVGVQLFAPDEDTVNVSAASPVRQAYLKLRKIRLSIRRGLIKNLLTIAGHLTGRLKYQYDCWLLLLKFSCYHRGITLAVS